MRISTGDTLQFWKYLLVVLVRRDDARDAAEALGAQCKQATNLSPGYTTDPNAHGPLTGSSGRPLGIHLISGYICCESEIKDIQNDVSGDSKSSSVAVVRPRNQTDLAGDVYYRNRLEFAFDAGWLASNL